MKLIKMLTVTLALSLCASIQAAGPTSATGSTGEDLSTDRGQTVSRSKELASTREKVITIEMPALPLAIQAMRKRGFATDHKEAIAASICTKPDGLRVDLNLAFNGPTEYTRTLFSRKSEDCVRAWSLRMTKPSSGWPVNALRNTEEVNDFLRRSLAASIANNEILTPIVAELTQRTGLTRDEFIAEITAALAASTYDWLDVYMEEFERPRSYVKDLTGRGPAPVHFTTSDGWDFQHGPEGAFLTYNGTPWYGQGYLMGQKYMLQTVRRRAARIVRTGATSAGTSTSVTQGADAGAALPQQ